MEVGQGQEDLEPDLLFSLRPALSKGSMLQVQDVLFNQGFLSHGAPEFKSHRPDGGLQPYAKGSALQGARSGSRLALPFSWVAVEELKLRHHNGYI